MHDQTTLASTQLNGKSSAPLLPRDLSRLDDSNNTIDYVEGVNFDEIDLHKLLTSHLLVKNVEKINYHQYLSSAGPDADDQWCFQAELFLRQQSPHCLVSLFSKELWCFSINDDPVPVPYPVESTSPDSVDVPEASETGNDDFTFSKLVNDAENKSPKVRKSSTEKATSLSTDNENLYSRSNLLNTEYSGLKPRKPDKIGQFTAQFSKPNLPTAYAIFLKAVRRAIYLNLSLSSKNQYVPFGNSCIFTDENKIINFDPHLFENGQLTLSLSIRSLDIQMLSEYFSDASNSSHVVLYMAPSSVKASLYFTENFEKNVSLEPPLNADSVLKTLMASHGIDLFYKKSDIKWIKVVPSLIHLSGQTPPISSYMQASAQEEIPHNTAKKFILWPLDLLFVQPALQCSKPTSTDSHLPDIFSFDEAFDLISDFAQLKLTSSYKVQGATSSKSSTGPLSSGASYYSDPYVSIGSVLPHKHSVSPNNYYNSSANTTPMHKSSPLLNYVSKNSPDASLNDQGMLPEQSIIYEEENKHSSHPEKEEQFLSLTDGAHPNSNTDLPPINMMEFPQISENQELGDSRLENQETQQKENVNNFSIYSVMDDDDDDDDDKGDEEELENRNAVPNENVDEKMQIDSPGMQLLSTQEQHALSENVVKASEEAFKFVPSSTLPLKRYLDIPFDEITQRDLYSDPGAPLPIETPREKRQSVYAPLNFNPIIEANVDNKYKNGGKFFVSSLNQNQKATTKNEKTLINSGPSEDPSGLQLSYMALASSEVDRNDKDNRDFRNCETAVESDDADLMGQGFGYNSSDSEMSSDEDDNGVISIHQLTNTRHTQPVTSLSALAALSTSSAKSKRTQVKPHNFTAKQPLMMYKYSTDQPAPASTEALFEDHDRAYRSSSALSTESQYIPLTIPSSNLLADPPNVASLDFNSDLKNKMNSKLMNSAKPDPDVHHFHPNHENLMTQNPLLSETVKSPATMDAMFWKADLGASSGVTARSEELSAQRSALFSPEFINFEKSDKSSPTKDYNHATTDEGLAFQTNKQNDHHAQTMNFEDQKQLNLDNGDTKDGQHSTSMLPANSSELHTVNVLPFVLRHMPLFSIPQFYLAKNPTIPNTGCMQDFLNSFTSEIVFNPQLKEFSFSERSYEVFTKLSNNSKIFTTLQSLFQNCTRMESNKLIDDFAKLEEPNVYVKKQDEEGNEVALKINSSSFEFVDAFRFKPFKKEKSFSGLLLTSVNSEDCLNFMNNLVLQYNDFQLGHCDLVQLTPDDEPGLIYLKNFDSHTLLLLAAQIVTYCFTQQRHFKDQNKPLVIFLPFDETKQVHSIVEMCYKFAVVKNEVLNRLPNCELFLRLIPIKNLVTNPLTTIKEYNRLCLSIYNILPRVTSKYTQLAHNPPKKAEIKLESSKSTGSSSLSNYHYDTYIHVAYSRSIDKEWISASWSTLDGSEFYVKTWYVGNSKTKFESFCNEIWATSLKFIALSNANSTSSRANSSASSMLAASGFLRTCIVLARLDSILPDDELMHWRRLSSKTKQIHLAVVCCGLNTKFTMYDSAACGPNTKTFNMQTGRFNYDNVEEQKKLSNDNFVLCKPRDDTYMAVFKYALPLSNSQHRCSIKSGALLKFKSGSRFSGEPNNGKAFLTEENSSVLQKPFNEKGLEKKESRFDDEVAGYNQNEGLVDKFEVNLLNCPHADSKKLLKTILKQYHDMSFLNPWFTVTEDDQDQLLPYHILAVSKVLQNVVHLKVKMDKDDYDI
ncbi:hypothetical protein ACO0QE_000712 [Hanseniaspora vineae]